LEVIMHTRRIAASACTLCLVVPAAAGASPVTDPPQTNAQAQALYGITTATPHAKGPAGATLATPQATVKAKGPAGATLATPQDTVKAKGPAGVTAATAQATVKAKGPAGTTTATGPRPDTTRATAHPAGASRRDGTSGWRTAAISEAALLAALALASALLLHRSARAPRMVT
jgi:hypothetical protein